MDEDDKFERALHDTASAMPQFDVREELTQSIVANAQVEKAMAGPEVQPWSLAAFATIAATLLAFNAFDSLWGGLSWLVGLAAMVGFKQLFETDDSQEINV